MSALVSQCFNALSATVARRWATSSAPLRWLSTNNTPGDKVLLWSKLLETASTTTSRTKLGVQTPEEAWLAQHKKTISSLTPPNNTYTGRSIPVRKDLSDTSVARAHALLEGRIRRNKVRRDYMANMRHEKKGVKRRRLESERWRRRFADHVRQKVQLVQEIRRRGA